MLTVKTRTSFLDLLRIIACFLVIVNHTNSAIFRSRTPESLTWYASLIYFFISKIAVPIFFMISGYLLLNKIDSYKKCLQRIFRIAIALIVCSFIYALYHTYHNNPDASFSSVIIQFQTTHFKSPTNALWYMYAYLGILIMLPFLQKMTHLMTKCDYLVFFAISGFFFSVLPILSHYFPDVKLNKNFQLPIFSAYISMLFIGQYFSRFGIKKTKFLFSLACLLFVLMLTFNVVATRYEYNKSSKSYLFFDNRTYLPILLQSVCVFYIISFVKIPEKLSKAVTYIGSCTFGIYLVSDMLIDALKPIYTRAETHIHPLFAVILFEICVFLTGLIIVSILKKVPLIKKIL